MFKIELIGGFTAGSTEAGNSASLGIYRSWVTLQSCGRTIFSRILLHDSRQDWQSFLHILTEFYLILRSPKLLFVCFIQLSKKFNKKLKNRKKKNWQPF